jgi:hypothetical protein
MQNEEKDKGADARPPLSQGGRRRKTEDGPTEGKPHKYEETQINRKTETAKYRHSKTRTGAQKTRLSAGGMKRQTMNLTNLVPRRDRRHLDLNKQWMKNGERVPTDYFTCGNVRKKAAEGPAFFDCKWCSDTRLDSLTDGRTRRKTDTDAHRRHDAHKYRGAASQ